ncbi:MAG: hypothetical protein A2133_10010 [Actinobacteria bacterium RBG_16_64_13]|nr:MAG: hypothetical protein A2133_10010 [Actinobacteria bacterium RBG_16_64_13]
MSKVPDTPENASRCICGGCPSFPAEGNVFCARGKSAKGIAKRGCICESCSLFGKYGLTDGYYCAAGAAEEGPR